MGFYPRGIRRLIRYLLWRLFFESANLARLLGHGPERVYYLAFGANLAGIVLRERRITPLAARPFTLRDWGLRFNHPSLWHGCAYASAEPAPGENLYGYLYTLSGRDAARMDFYEAARFINRYRRTWVEQDGLRLYFYQTNRATEGLCPTDEYLGFIVDGLAAHPDADPEYCRGLAQTPTAEPGPLVSSHLWEQPADRPAWLSRPIALYQRTILWLFLNLIYKRSLTEHFIRG